MPDPTLYLAREAARLGADRDLRSAHQSGRLARILTGVYAESSDVAALSTDERYRLLVRAAAAVSAPDAQFSHDSAAALWRLPTIGAWPNVAHQVIPAAPGGRSRRNIVRHTSGLDDAATEIDGVVVTSLARTLLDVAAHSTFARGVAMVDAALRPAEPGDFRHAKANAAVRTDALLSLHAERMPFRGSARSARAIAFATPLAGSPAESLFRVQCHALGLRAPQLQVPFDDEEGHIGAADTYWPHLGLAIEVDGRSKYRMSRRYRRDLSAEEVLWAEKTREDRMRRVTRDFARVTWAHIRDRPRLARFLASHGLHP